MKAIYSFFLLFVAISSYSQVSLKPQQMALDDSLSIAVFHIEKDLFKNNQIFLVQNITYTLSLDENGKASLSSPSGRKNYEAYNTMLPLFQINAPDGIVNEPKRLTTIQYAFKDNEFTSYAGIELRGSSSQFFPKKTYDINFYKDSTTKENRNIKFAGMRKDDDWILDGLYNEPLRLRSHLSLSLWLEIHKPYYLNKEPNALAGARTRHCEVFVNGSYKGIYLLSEQVDRKLLDLVKEDKTGVRGELFQGSAYQGAVTFDSIPPKKDFLPRWGGYDIEYPYPNNNPWDSLYVFTQRVVNGDRIAFAKAVNKNIYLDNVIDYFLFVNALRAPDNLGKNIYLARYDINEPYFYIPWDLDGTFGTIFNGKHIATTDDFLTNGLLRRLLKENPNDFINRFKNRWNILRGNTLATENLLNLQAKIYNDLIENNAYEREQKAWSQFSPTQEELGYMQDWTKKRLEFLDHYIESIKTTR